MCAPSSTKLSRLAPDQLVLSLFPTQIFNSRGNIASKRKDQLNNVMGSGLHWGPDPTLDKFSLTQGLYKGPSASQISSQNLSHPLATPVYRMFFNDEYCASPHQLRLSPNFEC